MICDRVAAMLIVSCAPLGRLRCQPRYESPSSAAAARELDLATALSQATRDEDEGLTGCEVPVLLVQTRALDPAGPHPRRSVALRRRAPSRCLGFCAGRPNPAQNPKCGDLRGGPARTTTKALDVCCCRAHQRSPRGRPRSRDRSLAHVSSSGLSQSFTRPVPRSTAGFGMSS
jgi:hypothetical protein